MKKIIFILVTLFICCEGRAFVATEHLSLITTPVLLLKGDSLVSRGTGFYYVLPDKTHGNIVFLITNHHVLTGHPPQEKELPIGDNIKFYLHMDNNNPGSIKEVRFPLFTKEGKQIWLNSNTFPNADIAIIPLVMSLYQDAKVSAISEDWSGAKLKVRPASPVILVGYPFGYFDTKNQLPIWKTGNVASEIGFDFEGEPKFIIDISAFPGMSGSPVFAIANGAYETEDGNTTIGTVKKFLGIYASTQMLAKKKYLEEISSNADYGIIVEESLQLGHVWKAKLIHEIVKSIDVEKYQQEILKKL